MQPRLLVIDDEPAITTLVKRVAESCGYQVAATSDPQEFRRNLDIAPPDMVCIDLSMPEVDGIELLGLLADRKCRASLLIISGFHHAIVVSALRLAEARGLNVGGTLRKPIHIAALREVLLQLVPNQGRLAARPAQ